MQRPGTPSANSILVVSYPRERLGSHGNALLAAVEAGKARVRRLLMRLGHDHQHGPCRWLIPKMRPVDGTISAGRWARPFLCFFSDRACTLSSTTGKLLTKKTVPK